MISQFVARFLLILLILGRGVLVPIFVPGLPLDPAGVAVGGGRPVGEEVPRGVPHRSGALSGRRQKVDHVAQPEKKSEMTL